MIKLDISKAFFKNPNYHWTLLYRVAASSVLDDLIVVFKIKKNITFMTHWFVVILSIYNFYPFISFWLT
jgi:hypothetical protein